MRSANSQSRGNPVSVIGIGTSAGDLESLQELLRAIPKNSGLAFIAIQHFSPDHGSHSIDIPGLGKDTSVIVTEATDGTALQRDHFYIIPPHHDVELEGDALRLIECRSQSHRSLPVDRLFRVMARELTSRAVGVILSGCGSDGVLGAADIKQHGGLVLVQTTAKAEFGSMPGDALRHHIDVSRVADIPRLVVDRVRYPSAPLPASTATETEVRKPVTPDGPFEELANRVIMERFCPAAVLINSEYEALHFAGPTHDYLEKPTKTATKHLLGLARLELRGPLRTLLHQSRRTGGITTTQVSSQSVPNAKIIMRSEPIDTDLGTEQKLTLVTFETTDTTPGLSDDQRDLREASPQDVVTQLEYELALTRQDLQDHVGQLEKVNDALQSANVELKSSREELQSVNEELITLNVQLNEKESLNRAKATLEQRVHERTVKLAEANLALQQGREKLEQRVQKRTEELAEAHRQAEMRAAKAAETAARDDAVLKSMGDGVAMIDPVGNIIEMNPAALQQHEFRSLQEAQQHFDYYAEAFELLDLKGQPLQRKKWPLPRVLNGEKFTNLIVQVHRFRTGRRWYANYSGTPVYGTRGEMTMGVLTIRDVTGIHEAENALRASEQRFHSAVDSYPSPFIIYDARRRIEFINPPGLEWLGLPEETVLGRTDEEILPETVTDTYLPALLRAISDKQRQIVEAELTWNGQTRTMTISYIPLLDEDGCIKQVLGITQDFSATVEAKRAVEWLNGNLRRRASELQIANRELESFAYSVSHDLRAPLRAISSFSTILREEYEGRLDAQADDYLHRISDSGLKMARLIDDLLSLSRITRRELANESVDLTKLVKKMVGEMMNNGICSENTRITVEPNLVAVADPALLQIALENLLRNACKFAGREEFPEIGIGRTEIEDESFFFVRDNGVGFDMAYAGNLFKPFQRLHDPADYEGTGIGLAVVQRVISRHGGRIWAEAKTGHGATFYFNL